MTTSTPNERRVVVVTGGGGGIGAAIAEELGRRGDHVVTVDPLVSVDGSELLPSADDTTAGRVEAAGGSAEASNTSVTDRDALGSLFDSLVATHGRLDAVVNVAGITRPTAFATGEEADWAAVLAVHLDGYRNVVDAAMPHFVAAGRGAILGVTSGSGWRPADAGAYSAAKRAVASLTWELGRVAPPGVAVNAISPIAMTRMVTAALARARGSSAAEARRPGPPPHSADASGASGSSKTGGLSLGGMPAPEELAPLAAHLVAAGVPLRGRILFAGGSEVATVEPPRLLEVVRTSAVTSVDAVLDGFTATLVAAEAAQATTGGANPRFTGLFDPPGGAAAAGTPGPADVRRCALVVTDRAEVGSAVAERLHALGVVTELVSLDVIADGFSGTRAEIDRAAAMLGGLDAVVVATSSSSMSSAEAYPTGPEADADGWQAVVTSHAGLADLVLADVAWNRAAAELATVDRPLRVVHLVDASSPGGRSRAQAAMQQARMARKATGDRVAAFAVAVEDPAEREVAAALGARLAATADVALSGAELVVGSGWVGLRSHPAPGASVVFGGPQVPPWFDAVLGELGR